MPSAEEGVPDGMKVDISGRVFCVGSGGIWVVEPSGEIVAVIKGPAVPRNIAFGDADLRTLYTTPGDSVYSVRVKTPGIVAF
jgi:gluconolactonase